MNLVVPHEVQGILLQEGPLATSGQHSGKPVGQVTAYNVSHSNDSQTWTFVKDGSGNPQVSDQKCTLISNFLLRHILVMGKKSLLNAKNKPAICYKTA